MYVGHRKTLHYPVYYTALAALAVPVAVAAPSTVTVAAALFLSAAALHCVADIFGSGLELRPWEGSSERAVCDHARGEWIPPRRAVSYDGSPADLLLTGVFAAPLLMLLDGLLWAVVAGTALVAVVYTLTRRHLAALAPVVVGVLPSAVHPYVPARYRGGNRTQQ